MENSIYVKGKEKLLERGHPQFCHPKTKAVLRVCFLPALVYTLTVTSEAPGASGPGGGDPVLSTLLLAQGHTGASDSLASAWQLYLGPVTSLPPAHC